MLYTAGLNIVGTRRTSTMWPMVHEEINKCTFSNGFTEGGGVVIKPGIRMLTHVCPPAAAEEWLRGQSTQSPCTQDRVTCTYNDYIHHWPQTGPLRYILYPGNDTCLQDIYEIRKKDNCYKHSVYSDCI